MQLQQLLQGYGSVAAAPARIPCEHGDVAATPYSSMVASSHANKFDAGSVLDGDRYRTDFFCVLHAPLSCNPAIAFEVYKLLNQTLAHLHYHHKMGASESHASLIWVECQAVKSMLSNIWLAVESWGPLNSQNRALPTHDPVSPLFCI